MKASRKSILIILSLFVATFAHAQNNLIPAVKSYKELSTKVFSPKTIKIKVVPGASLPAEGYTLRTSASRVDIVAKDSAAAVWARQTLRQLTDAAGNVPHVEITDYPEFPFRAFMHDTGRNFIEIDMIKRHIDLISSYKLNVFHWHLTDYPAWRIECRVYPELNDAKFQRKGRDEGRFYTYDQIRDVIAYAKERGITVVPEIDMPGHSTYFNSTFGFSMDSKEGMAVLEKCLDEFFTEIPVSMCPYFHIGSDEVRVADPQGFMTWAEGIAKKYGRDALAWDPGLPSSPTTIRQIWNEAAGANSAAAKKPGRYVDSFMGYLNFYDPLVYTNRNFLHKACGVEKANENAIGGILCLWNDVNVDDKTRTELHSGMVNGLLAFAERFWVGGNVDTGGDVKNQNVLPSPATAAGAALGEFEGRVKYHRDNLLQGQNMRWVANASQPWQITIPALRGTDTTTMKWVSAWGGAIDMAEFCAVNKVKESPAMDAWAVTYVYSERDTVIRAWVGFEAPARSNRISGGIGYQGEWENEGRVTVNGIAVKPSVEWKEPGGYKFHFHTWGKPQEEFPYTDEQFYWMREPAYVPLKAGANKIEVYAPKTFDGQRWSFAFIPLTLHDDGTVTEVEGIDFQR